MSKTSSADYPAFSKGQISINGENKASTSGSGGNITSNYNMNEYEKAVYDYAQKTLSEILPSLNVFSSDTMNNINSQINAYTAQGQKTIENLYTPMLTNLKNDIASRFGNFDNSMFMDNLNKIESSRADSMSTLAQNILSQQNDLYNDELNRRYNYINLLQNLQNSGYTNALNYMAAALSNSNAGNSYNANAYNAYLKTGNSNAFNYGLSNSNINNLANSAALIASMFG